MGEKHILQRIRFRDGTPPAASSPGLPEPFDPQRWTLDREATYWTKSGQTTSADSFFNAFYLSYWKTLTTLRTLGLTFRYSGHFQLSVLAFTENNAESVLLRQDLTESDSETEVSIDLPFVIETTPYVRIAFTLMTLKEDSRLIGGGWHTTDTPAAAVSLGILIPTFNRPHFVEPTVRRILGDPGLLSENVHIWLVEQSDTPELDSLAGDRCHVIRQANLGSTGGYTRALYESLYKDHGHKPTHVLFMDDDVDLETDSILRSIRFLQFAREPFILSGVMLDLYRPAIAANLGEFYSKAKTHFYYWVLEHLQGCCVTTPEGLRNISKPVLGDVASWWFAIFPISVVESIGLPIPLFLKMDDVEYSIRARRQGVPLYSVPGIGLWHVPFGGKGNDAIEYIAFYNHLLINTCHGIEEGAGMLRLVSVSAMDALNARRYRSAASFIRCLEDFVGGWAYFRDATFPNRWVEVCNDLASFPDGKSPIESHQKKRIAGLNSRLKDAYTRGMSNLESIRAELVRQLPKTTTPTAWKSYFERGNSSAVS